MSRIYLVIPSRTRLYPHLPSLTCLPWYLFGAELSCPFKASLFPHCLEQRLAHRREWVSVWKDKCSHSFLAGLHSYYPTPYLRGHSWAEKLPPTPSKQWQGDFVLSTCMLCSLDPVMWVSLPLRVQVTYSVGLLAGGTPMRHRCICLHLQPCELGLLIARSYSCTFWFIGWGETRSELTWNLILLGFCNIIP